MAGRRLLHAALALGLGGVLLLSGRLAWAGETEPASPLTRGRTVSLDQSEWFEATNAAPAAPSAGPGLNLGAALHETDVSRSHFRFTTVRLWAYRNFLPKSKDADILGIEADSAWSIGKLDFTNISYFEIADYPRPVPGMPIGNEAPGRGAATGISDFLTAFLVSPKSAHHGPHHFAVGVGVQAPTATDDTLGSGKWAMGPAVEYEYEKGRLFAAVVAIQFWSFAGDASRKNVNMLMIKPMITYDLGRRWKAVYMPYGISVYWEKKREDMVYLPLGGGAQYDFRIGRQKMAASLQFFNYTLRPSKGAENELRFMLEFDF